MCTPNARRELPGAFDSSVRRRVAQSAPPATAPARALVVSLGLLACVSPAAAVDLPTRADFVDADDGYVDVSRFLDRSFGFVPLVVPITEPAVGYGALGALVFIDRRGEAGSESFRRPNLYAAGGLRTDNGTRGAFAGGTTRWLDGRLDVGGGLIDADVNLDLYLPGNIPLGYSASVRGGAISAKYRLGESSWWLGARYAYADIAVRFDLPGGGGPLGLDGDSSLALSSVSALVSYDTRDNLFTPTRGLYADLSWTVADDAIGSDRNFQRADFVGLAFHPLDEQVFLGAKLGARWSSDETPFYLRPFIQLRGVQAMRYQGAEAGEIEVEARWQFHPRFSVVGFGGVGVAAGRAWLDGGRETVAAGGAGFRYLIARNYGMHMGIDVARGPDQTIWYVVFGNGWFRP